MLGGNDPLPILLYTALIKPTSHQNKTKTWKQRRTRVRSGTKEANEGVNMTKTLYMCIRNVAVKGGGGVWLQ